MLSTTEIIEVINGITTGMPAEEVEELDLDEIGIVKITKELQTSLEKFPSVKVLKLNGCNLESLENCPWLCELERLELEGNMLTGKDLPIIASRFPCLVQLNLSGNLSIGDTEAVKPLKALTLLEDVEFAGCPIIKKPEYRKKVFEMIPSLKILDRCFKNGEPVGEDYYLEQFEPEEEDDNFLEPYDPLREANDYSNRFDERAFYDCEDFSMPTKRKKLV